MGRSALRQQWAAPPIKAQSVGKNNIRKISQEKTPDTSYMQCRRTPYLLARAHRTSLIFMARGNFVGITETQVSCNLEFM